MKTKSKSFIITKEWLNEQNACEEGTRWFLAQRSKTIDSVILKLIKEQRFEWANWTLTKAMNKRQQVLYACFAARQCLKSFTDQFPSDDRPLKAIEAAERWAINTTDENKSAAWSAAESAASAARLAESAAWAVWAASAESAARAASAESAASAASAARAARAARLAESAAESAGSAESAAESSVWAAARLAESAAAWTTILKRGLKLLKHD